MAGCFRVLAARDCHVGNWNIVRTSQNNATGQVSILGCGWLGLPLASRLIAEGFRVKGSTSTAEKRSRLEDVGIAAFQIQLDEDAINGDVIKFLEGSAVLIIDIPPGLRRDPASDFTEKMRRMVSAVEASATKHSIFISSTSVFEDTTDFPTYTEADPPNGVSETARQLAIVEAMLMDSTHFTTTILRFGGLCGPGRNPRNFLAGSSSISNPDAPVNLIHQDDCIALIHRIMARQAWGAIFHGVYPDHPQKRTYGSFPTSNEVIREDRSSSTKGSVGKIVSSGITQELLKFQFRHKP